jgi:Uma2 family endonuclease
MAETDIHFDVMADSRLTLRDFFVPNPLVYVTGNLLLYYVEGDRRKHVAPDVFVVFGVSNRKREYYLLWEEGKGPDVAIEITSKSTRREDLKKKFELYRDVLKVAEYFLFDPREEYLHPSLQGHRLVAGNYQPISLVNGRLPSELLGLHLERDGNDLRFYDPRTGQWLLTRQEKAQSSHDEANRAKEQADLAQAENDRLRAELDALRRKLSEGNK